MIDINTESLKTAIDDEVLTQSTEMEKRMATMFEQHRKLIGHAITSVAAKFTPYDTNDTRKVLESQKERAYDLLSKNAILVTENSELCMHLSFMSVEYRDFVNGIQTTNHKSYRNQRSDPKVIIPDTGQLDSQAPIRLMNAPMAHPSVVAMFHLRDIQYETFYESKKALDKGFALRARITENADIKRIPKSEAPRHQQPGTTPRSAIPLRVPLDQRLVHTADLQDMPDQTPPMAPHGGNKGAGHVYDTKGAGKGKRQPYEMASRSQPPLKSARSGDSVPSPWLKATMSMPTPPGVVSESSSVTSSAPQPRTELTPGQAGVRVHRRDHLAVNSDEGCKAL